MLDVTVRSWLGGNDVLTYGETYDNNSRANHFGASAFYTFGLASRRKLGASTLSH